MKIEIKLEDNFQVNPEYAEEVVDYFLNASREQLLGDIKKGTPVDYGLLRRSWAYKQYKLGDGNQKLRISNSREYAIFVEQGTGIFKGGHRIFPRNAQVFRATIKKEVVYFRHHKGQPGKHMMERGVEQYTVKIPSLFSTAVRKTALKKAGK